MAGCGGCGGNNGGFTSGRGFLPSGGVLDHGFQKAHGFRLQKYGLIAFPVTYRSCPETVGDLLLRWISAVAAVVRAVEGFLVPPQGGSLFVICF